MVEAEIFQNNGTVRRTIRFDSLILRFGVENRWEHAAWEFLADGEVTRLPAEPIEEITAIASRFEIMVIDGQGNKTGPLTVESVMCGYPAHSLCFLFRVDEDDLWSGHTVTRSFGKIAVVPYRFDPS